MSNSSLEKRKKKNKEKEEEKSLGREILDYIKTIAIVVVVVILVQQFLVINAEIPSQSMQNTVMMGDRIFGNRLAYKVADPQRYDIIIFRYPDDPTQLFIKRVIGLPGETVTIKEDGIYINDETEPLSEEFCPEKPNYSLDIGTSYVVPEDSYFVMGDNRNNSKDSRRWVNHFVSKDAILGEAFFRYWPLNKIKLFNHENDYYDPTEE